MTTTITDADADADADVCKYDTSDDKANNASSNNANTGGN